MINMHIHYTYYYIINVCIQMYHKQGLKLILKIPFEILETETLLKLKKNQKPYIKNIPIDRYFSNLEI